MALEGAVVVHNTIHKPSNSAGACYWETLKQVTYSPETLYRNWASVRLFHTSTPITPATPQIIDPQYTDLIDTVQQIMLDNDWDRLARNWEAHKAVFEMVLKYGPLCLMPTDYAFQPKTSGLWLKPCNGLTREVEEKGKPKWMK